MERLFPSFGPRGSGGSGLAALAIKCGLLMGGALVTVVAFAPAAWGAKVPGGGVTPAGQCAPPSAPTLSPAPADSVFFAFDHFDQVQLSATAPLTTNPNAGCGPVTYQVYGWSGSSALTPLASTTSVSSGGSLVFAIPSVLGGSPFSFYVTASGITGASDPSNVVTLTLPSLTAISTPQQALALLASGNTLYFNWPGFGVAPVTTPSGPSGPWQDPNGQPLPVGTGILQSEASPAG